MRFTLHEVSDVTAIPIDGATYSESNRRAVSNEEAYDLVCVLTGGCQDGSTALLPLIQSPDAGFYDLDAWNSISHVGFFDVDVRTADVWSGVICSRFETPSLTKLQRVIRRRIGLTDEQYRRAPATGPICEPGEKPQVFREK